MRIYAHPLAVVMTTNVAWKQENGAQLARRKLFFEERKRERKIAGVGRRREDVTREFFLSGSVVTALFQAETVALCFVSQYRSQSSC